MKIQDSKDAKTGEVSTTKNIFIGTFMSIAIAVAAACGVHQLRWNIANPGYAAAREGISMLFGK